MELTNDPDLSGKYLGTISADFIKVADTLKEAAYQVRKRGFSDYPIFPICKEEQPVGKLLVGRREMDTSWYYYITYLDEFIQRDLISADRADDFRRTYKSPDEYCCLFVIDPNFTNFVFIPYPED